MQPERAPKREWPLLLGPQAFVGRPEGAVFAAICVVTLLLVWLAELAAPKHATLGAVDFIPIVAAGWLLSRRLTITVVCISLVLRSLAFVAGPVDPITALAQIMTEPVMAVVARLAAVSTLRFYQTEARLTSVSLQSARTAELERAKSDFMRLASHELRGPVAVLRGYLSMLEDGSLGQLPEGARRVMPVLAAKVQAMNRLVDEMLETARLEDSRLQLNKDRVELGALLRSVAVTAQQTLPPAHRLVLDWPRKPVEVEADAARIATILSNLIDNAVKYSPEGGDVHCSVNASRGRAQVSVADHGLGIDAVDLSTLFSRFGRIVTPDNSHISGTGLGLYLSRELARMHEGDIKVASEPGRGSTFTLDLPLAEKQPSREAAGHAERRRQLV